MRQSNLFVNRLSIAPAPTIYVRQNEVFDEADPRLVERFFKFHEENPKIYEQFKLYSQRLLSGGRKHYSAWPIIAKIRFEYDVQTSGPEFKISNDFIALYARLLIAEDISFKDFFKLKKMKKVRKPTTKRAPEVKVLPSGSTIFCKHGNTDPCQECFHENF
jgi:hypothetical protein